MLQLGSLTRRRFRCQWQLRVPNPRQCKSEASSFREMLRGNKTQKLESFHGKLSARLLSGKSSRADSGLQFEVLFIGEWCNWQHASLWHSKPRFEP